ncbi:MFS transporter [Haloactinopolyspora sp.]|uniref:MFS transporter n=1 Tax=Haloactinopolyspora sp. TaxID=1966353 RepID=UPI00260416A4|nr:MFS transporter [Haloactinopolyspora sp.]
MAAGKNRWALVAGAGIAVFMAQLDATVVQVALPTIEADFGTATSLSQWVVLAYVLPLIALSLPSGRWLDGVGARAALTFAVTGFAVSSTAVGLAPGMGWLIAARVVQGGFGAVLFALVPVLATTAVRPEARGRAMGVVMTLGPLGGVSGPLLGGLLVDTLGWPAIFYLNVPVGLLVIGIGLGQLPADRGLSLPDRSWAMETGLIGAAAIAVMLGLSLAAEGGPAWLLLLIAAVPFVAMWRRSASSEPVRELFGARGMPGPHLALMLEMTAVMAVLFLVPFFLHQVAGATTAQIGVTMLAFPVMVMAFGFVSGVLADRFGATRVVVTGSVIIAIGLLLLAPLSSTWSAGDLAWRLAVAGAGAGLFAGPNQTLAMARSPRHLLGTTGASTSLARQLGIAFGPALTTTVWSLAGDGVDGMRAAVLLAVVLAASSGVVQRRRTSINREPVRTPVKTTA